MNRLTDLTPETLPGVRETPTSLGSPGHTLRWPKPRAHVGLLILFGPETRAFLHSGFAARLAEQYRVSVITANPASAAFAKSGPWRVYSAPVERPPAAFLKLRGWNRRLHRIWMQQRQSSLWTGGTHDGRASNRNSGRGAGTARNGAAYTQGNLPRWLRLAALAEQSVGSFTHGGKAWEGLYKTLELDCLVAADYASPAAAEALFAAARASLPTIVLTNSWKDVYVHPFVGTSLSAIGVTGWPEADHIRRANPQLAPHQVAVTGSLHLERFLRPREIPRRADFCRPVGLDPSRPFLCYTAAAPSAVREEESIVESMLEIVERHPRQPQALLRLNPREDGERFRRLQSRYANLAVQRPRWEWDPEADWNAPRPEDLDSWVATVHHAAFNVSIPSTVTLEFAALGRLTLNVCFDATAQPPDTSNARFWNAPFYQSICNSPLVAGAFSASEFRELLACRLDSPGAWRLSPPRRSLSPVDEAEGLLQTVLAIRGVQPALALHAVPS